MNWKGVILYLLLGLGLIVVLGLSVPASAEENSSAFVDYNNTISGYGAPLNYTPYIVQGSDVYLNSTIDISGVVPPYPMLGYWDGYDFYDSNATYIYNLPDNKQGYYHFYIDPEIFASRLGKWYKYNGAYESNSYNLAFIVSPATFNNYTLTYPNGSVFNLSIPNAVVYQEVGISKPPVPIKRIADYLVARGDSLNLTVSQATNLWLFGRDNQLLDHSSVNESIDVSADVLSHFEPGRYTLITQTMRNGTDSFTVRYDSESNTIQWFDPEQFKIHSEPIDGYSPQVVQEKFKQILPYTYDNFTQYHMEFQEPSLEIISIEEKLNPNETINQVGDVEYNTNTSFVLVMGYTNVAPASVLRFVLDEKQQSPRTIKSHTTTVTAEGTYGGDMRWFRAVIPVDKYGLAAGEHAVTGYTNLSKTPTNVNFFVYEAKEGTYTPLKTVRYIGGNEFVPTPTPIIETVTVVQTVQVVQTIEIPVTPSQESVDQASWNTAITLAYIVIGAIVGVVVLFLVVRFLYRAYKRRAWVQK